MKELAQLIVKAVASFDSVVAAAACGCEIPRGYDLTETRRIYVELSREFDLNLDGMSGVVAGTCSTAPLEALMGAYRKKHSMPVGSVSVQGGVIIVHHLPAGHPLYAALRELTTQEVCSSEEMERRQAALRRA